jgi:hypothetical protein
MNLCSLFVNAFVQPVQTLNNTSSSPVLEPDMDFMRRWRAATRSRSGKDGL